MVNLVFQCQDCPWKNIYKIKCQYLDNIARKGWLKFLRPNVRGLDKKPSGVVLGNRATINLILSLQYMQAMQ